MIAQSARMGWMPSYPTFNRNPLDLADEAAAAGRPVAEHVVAELKSGDLRFAAEDPDSPENFPRILAIWRANLLGSSGKGNEYFLKHLLGTDNSLRATEAGRPPPQDVDLARRGPGGKLDLLLTLDFRQTSTTIFSDVVLPAATWYEKHDLNTTDMHPFVHSFNPAIAPPWQTRTDWDAWQTIATSSASSPRPARHPHRRRRRPLLHDTPTRWPTRTAWSGLEAGECEPVPGDDAQAGRGRARLHGSRAKMQALGPLMEKLGTTTKGVTYDVPPRSTTCVQERRRPRRDLPTADRPSSATSRLRGDPGAVRHHQRAPRHPGLQDPGEAHRHACTTSPPSTRASRSPSPTPRPRRSRSSPRRSGQARRPVAGATRRSRSTSSGSSPGTR